MDEEDSYDKFKKLSDLAQVSDTQIIFVFLVLSNLY